MKAEQMKKIDPAKVIAKLKAPPQEAVIVLRL